MNEKIKKIARKVIFYLKVTLKNLRDPEKILLFFKAYPFTMVSYEAMSNVYDLAKKVEKEKMGGAFVECGVWKGGCIAIMAAVAKKAGSGRKIWLFDSFEGLPEPTKDDGEKAKDYALGKMSGKLSTIEKCVGPLEDVKKIFFKILSINPADVVVEKGWFQDTLKAARNKIGSISILRLDGDWYESTKCCLEDLYSIVIPGGYVIIDDYIYWEGSKKAVDEFMAKNNIKAELVNIDYTAVYFKKPK